MKTKSLVIIAIILLVGCKNKTNKADAFGNFEATEVIISAETNGRILQFDPVEGSHLEKNGIIALVDTTMLNLQSDKIDAGMRSVKTTLSSINAQNDILKQQIENINVNISRFGKCLKMMLPPKNSMTISPDRSLFYKNKSQQTILKKHQWQQNFRYMNRKERRLMTR